MHVQFNKKRGDIVGIMSRIRSVQAGDRGSVSGLGKRFGLTRSWGNVVWFVAGTREFFSSLEPPDCPCSPPTLAVEWLPGTLCLEVECIGLKTDRSLLSSAQVKNDWSSTSSPPHVLMACIGTTLPCINFDILWLSGWLIFTANSRSTTHVGGSQN